jgi:hypothetical protein
MKIFSWNCRGLSMPVVVQTLRRLIRDQSPGVLFLSETKNLSFQVSVTLNRLGFFLMAQVAASGSSGGLVLSWRPRVDLECFTSNSNNISAWCYSDPPHPLILHEFSLMSMAPQKEMTNWLFGILLLPLGMALKPLGFALVILTQLWISLKKLVVGLFLVLPIALLESL